VNEYITSASKGAGTSIATEDWANQTVAESLINNFEEACGDGLRFNINQVRLYLEDERTVTILVTHVLERITAFGAVCTR
jgi:conserved oligomeric Golgi complex subunit 3